ncbi:L,D-transpeptidase family protein [Sphingomonas cannabina]|uniref:L,D-transpeptidase family protein n=1 Tax=Sphingomonas cannabina TaxID=2899123 RepID=UPI001EFF9B6B|nr:L,D-transpeptidase family protein [Sphingomonas cannabina]UIJ44234.1 L,D-transpeptidase family protein [Sphingomonas cannabina]
MNPRGWGKAAVAALGLMLAAAAPAAFAREDAVSLEQAALALKPGQYLWRDPGPDAGEVSVVVSLPLQAVYVFRGEVLIGVASASTGTAGHRTPAGTFTILQKRVFHRSNLYSNAPMPFMQRLTWGGIALHAGHNPGYPASHGCIRLPRAFAQLLFDATRIGGAVAIVNGEWSVPSRDREIPVIIARIDELQSSPDYVAVTFTPRAAPPQQQLASLERPPVSRPGLRVRGDEWLVPEARLIFPEMRRAR